MIRLEGLATMTVVDFGLSRAAALQRYRSDIAQMKKTLRGLASGTTAHALVTNIIKTLEIKAAKLSSPTRARARRLN
jgi:hypothetical protein